jgi:hypothetical protein
MLVFGVTVKGTHPDLYQKRYYGTARSMSEAMTVARLAATDAGWEQVEFDDITCLGPLAFTVPQALVKEQDHGLR